MAHVHPTLQTLRVKVVTLMALQSGHKVLRQIICHAYGALVLKFVHVRVKVFSG
jgi:predicted thioesterase